MSNCTCGCDIAKVSELSNMLLEILSPSKPVHVEKTDYNERFRKQLIAQRESELREKSLEMMRQIFGFQSTNLSSAVCSSAHTHHMYVCSECYCMGCSQGYSTLRKLQEGSNAH
jgi:hypothetical protein